MEIWVGWGEQGAGVVPRIPTSPFRAGKGAGCCAPLGGVGGTSGKRGQSAAVPLQNCWLGVAPSPTNPLQKKKKAGKGQKKGVKYLPGAPPPPPREECGVLAPGADAELLPGSCTLACVGRRQIAYPNEMNGLINHPPGSAEKHGGGVGYSSGASPPCWGGGCDGQKGAGAWGGQGGADPKVPGDPKGELMEI